MSTYAYPSIVVDGQYIAGWRDGAGIMPTLVAVDKLAVTWGRSSVLDKPTAATATVVVLDTSRSRYFARRDDLVGLPITIGYGTGDGSTGTTFAGRITDVDVVPSRAAAGGYRVELAASSREVDAANFRAPAGSSWPAESFGSRALRIWNLLPSSWFPGGYTLPVASEVGIGDLPDPTRNLSDYTAGAMDAGGKDALSLLRDLYASMSALPMVYNPGVDGFRFAPLGGHGYAQGMTNSAILSTSPDFGGRYVCKSLGRLHIDAKAIAGQAASSQAIDSRITRVEVQWINGTAAATTSASTPFTAAEGSIGRRTLGVQSLHAGANEAAQLAGMYAALAGAAGAVPRIDPLEWSTSREPFHDTAHCRALLSGVERGDELFVGRAWFTDLGRRPLVSNLGGRIVYAGGEWAVTINPGPVVVTGLPGWAPVPIGLAGVPGVTLAQIDRSVTFGDVGFIDIGAGYSESTMLSYKGNGL